MQRLYNKTITRKIKIKNVKTRHGVSLPIQKLQG